MSQESTEQVTTKNKKRRNYLSYPYDYYTGSSVRIFFGHVWVDDIVTIQYSLNQNKTPIYGYASQKFDAVARGQILVQGSFTVAFKEAGYLNVVHNYFQDLKNGSTKDKNEVLHYWLSKNKPIEQILDELYMNGESKSDFEDLSEALEDYVWRDFGVPSRSITRLDEFDYKDNGGIDLSGFDIVMTFGDYSDGEAEHTVKVINDIHIIGESMVVTPDGSPIGLNYTFFARSIDENISNVYNIPEEKKPEGLTGDTEIDNKMDAEYPSGSWNVMIMEAWDNAAEKVGSLTGRGFYDSFKIDKLYTQSNVNNEIKQLNVNEVNNLKTIRSKIKTNLLESINKVNLNTYRDGYYSKLQIIKLNIVLNMKGPDEVVTNNEDHSTIKEGDVTHTQTIKNARTLDGVQFKLMGNRWVDFSDDDEYNMRAQGVTDVRDLKNSEGQSQNERDAEIRAGANLDTLKMIYSGEKTSTMEAEQELEDQNKLREDKRQEDLAAEFDPEYLAIEQANNEILSAKRKELKRLKEANIQRDYDITKQSDPASILRNKEKKGLVSASDITELAGDLTENDISTRRINIPERIMEPDNTGGRSTDKFNTIMKDSIDLSHSRNVTIDELDGNIEPTLDRQLRTIEKMNINAPKIDYGPEVLPGTNIQPNTLDSVKVNLDKEITENSSPIMLAEVGDVSGPQIIQSRTGRDTRAVGDIVHESLYRYIQVEDVDKNEMVTDSLEVIDNKIIKNIMRKVWKNTNDTLEVRDNIITKDTRNITG